MAARRIVLATRNRGKVPELQRILAEALPGEVEVVTLADVAPDAPDVVEDGTSFEANSLLKARAACELTGLPAIADDSGLCVDVLGGAPGIFSARWSGGLVDSGGRGAGADKDADNNALLLAQLADVPDGARAAHFACVMSYVDPDGTELTERGEMHGSILREPQGENGFGYDPVFAVESGELAEARFTPIRGPVSSAELPAEVKNRVSHRGRATRALAERLAQRG
ncbi:non-canonical purine NTP pyrophosphatase [Kytococcus sp. Marseille-QA3725]